MVEQQHRSLSHCSDFAAALHCVPETRSISLLCLRSPVRASALASVERLTNNATMQMWKCRSWLLADHDSASTEQSACLTQEDLKRLLERFFVDDYNQSIHLRKDLKTRLHLWESRLASDLAFSTKQSN
jgi:hypothetical protein